MPNHHNQNPGRGFTLVEMLIVIAVIAILAAILLPVFDRAKGQAENANCLSNLRQWGIAWRVYADENNDSFMTGTSVPWARGAWILAFTNNLNSSLLLCPKAVNRRGPDTYEVPVPANDSNAVAYGGPTTVYDFPINDPTKPGASLVASYGVNCWIYNPDTNNVQGRDAALHWRKYGNAFQPSVTPLFADSMWRGAGPLEDDPPPDLNGEWAWGSGSLNFGDMDLLAIKRHGRGINILYFDGSAQNTPVKTLWQLPWHKDWSTTNETSVFPEWMN